MIVESDTPGVFTHQNLINGSKDLTSEATNILVPYIEVYVSLLLYEAGKDYFRSVL